MKPLLIFFFIIISVNSFSQVEQHNFADAGYIYKNFSVGGSTASLWFYSKSVDTMQKVQKFDLTGSVLDTLNFLIGHVKSARHFQQKVGPSFYARIRKNGAERRIAIVPGWAIIDLQNRRQYIFRGTAYAEVYKRFVDNNYRR